MLNIFIKQLPFVGVAHFEAMNKKHNTMKGKLTKNIYKQVPVVSTFYMLNKLGNPSYSESFGKNCVRDFVEKIIYLQSFMHIFL